MTLINLNLKDKAQKYASIILKEQLPSELSYHNYQHTEMVVNAVETIGRVEKLSEEELEVVQLAAWFHDTGFRDTYKDHEEKSKTIAEEFLMSMEVPQDKIDSITACILATQADNTPNNKLECVICDADLFHFTDENYMEYADKLRKEWKAVLNQVYTDLEWYRMNTEFISKQKFHTEYGQSVIFKAKERILSALQKKSKKLQKKADLNLMAELGVTPEELKSLKKKLKKGSEKPERGIETMFRLTSKNHLTLSDMADNKANIMISVNSIIISILLGSLMQKLDNNPHLVIPTIVLLCVNLGSMIFSILSIRPNVTKGLFTREDIENHRTNLLFFGNFHKVKRDDYHWGMNQLMENASFLYSSLIDDIYFLGVVLARKYKLLRFSYNVFMYGIVVAVIAFVISNFYAEPNI